MSLHNISLILEAEVLAGHDLLERPIARFYATDMMSRVLALSPSGTLLLTSLTNVQVINTAEVAGLGGVVFLEGKRPSIEVVEKAKRLSLPALLTRHSQREAGRILTEGGVPGL
ncbi:MAG: transcriptional regulator [Pseudomonadota bacterium]